MIEASSQISTLLAALQRQEEECEMLKQQVGGRGGAPVQKQAQPPQQRQGQNQSAAAMPRAADPVLAEVSVGAVDESELE